MKENEIKYATGRKKEAVARVYLTMGSGKYIINKQKVEDFATTDYYLSKLMYPLNLLEVANQFDIKVFVKGGGYSSQCDAISFGVTYALNQENEDFHKILKDANALKRDTRIKERKKYGLKKARKAPQFSKR